jgi:hypothetical protein
MLCNLETGINFLNQKLDSLASNVASDLTSPTFSYQSLCITKCMGNKILDFGILMLYTDLKKVLFKLNCVLVY